MKTSLYTLAFLAAGARALVAQAPATPTTKSAVQQHIPKTGATTAPAPARQAPATAAPARGAVVQQGAQQGTPARKGAAPAAKATPAPAPAKGAAAASAAKTGAPAAKGAAAPAKTSAVPAAKGAAPAKTSAAPPAKGAVPARTAAAPARGAAASRTTGAPAAAAGATTMTATKAVKDTVVPRVLMREAFDYAPDGRRDPFVSLMNTSDLRPTISDLRLTGILYDLSGRRPVAVMRDVQTNAQYRVTTGMTLGRMRVARIKPKVIVFSIEEFGLNRQDSLVLGDTSRVRTK